MSRHILKPQDFQMPGMPATIPALDIERRPIMHHCLRCRELSTLVLPTGPGTMWWLCGRCRQENRLDFGPAPKLERPDGARLELRRRPIRHECQDCGKVDCVVLPPGGGGDLRWECACGSVWLIRWRGDSGRLAKVSQVKNIVAPEQPGTGLNQG